jgi:hypothetical protein
MIACLGSLKKIKKIKEPLVPVISKTLNEVWFLQKNW